LHQSTVDILQWTNNKNAPMSRFSAFFFGELLLHIVDEYFDEFDENMKTFF